MTLTVEQHAIRATRIGGSDAAAALGMSSFKTPYQLYREKVDGMRYHEPDAEAAEWGHILEPAVAAKWSSVTKRPVIETPGYTAVSDEFPWLVASPDRIVDADAVRVEGGATVEVRGVREGLECKAWSYADAAEWGDEATDQVPDDVLMQCGTYLAVFGATRWHVGLLYGARRFRRYEIARHPRLIEMIVEGTRDFARRIAERDPPPVTTLADVRLAFPRSTERAIEANEEVRAAIEALRAARREKRTVEEAEAEAELAIKAFMGEADTLTVRGVPVLTWKTAKPRAGYYVKPQEVGSRIFRPLL